MSSDNNIIVSLSTTVVWLYQPILPFSAPEEVLYDTNWHWLDLSERIEDQIKCPT